MEKIRKMKLNKKLLVVLIIASGIVSAGIVSYFIITAFIITDEKFFDIKIQVIMANYKIPSLAAGIVINDTLVWAKGYGEQPDLDTVYMIGSITKTFTATAILQLNESNLFNLDDDINDYLPFDVKHPNYTSTPITIRMLLSHTAGLARDLSYALQWYFDNTTIGWMNNNLGTNITYWEPRPSLEEFLNGSFTSTGLYYSSHNWDSEPGSHFLYSNTGFILLGYLIEQITNQSLPNYYQENILDPLNMINSGCNFTDFVGKNAIPYERIGNRIYEIPLYNWAPSGAGSLRSTVPDMAKYMIAHMNLGKVNETQILKPKSVELMSEKQVSLTGPYLGFDLDGYGLGWLIYENNFRGHDGATPGYLANMFINENEKGTFGVILMFNRGISFAFDIELFYKFYPEINQILLERAEDLFY